MKWITDIFYRIKYKKFIKQYDITTTGEQLKRYCGKILQGEEVVPIPICEDVINTVIIRCEIPRKEAIQFLYIFLSDLTKEGKNNGY